MTFQNIIEIHNDDSNFKILVNYSIQLHAESDRPITVCHFATTKSLKKDAKVHVIMNVKAS